MSTTSIYDIKEDEIDIEDRPWNDGEVQQLAWKNIYITQRMIDYWQPFLDRGHKLMEMYDGRILDDTRRAIYEDIEDKITIEPPIMKAPIRALLGHAIKSRKSGAVGVEDGDLDNPAENPIEIETVDICLKHMEKKTKEQIKIRDAIHDSLVSCFPNVLLYQLKRPTADNPLKYDLKHPAWNSCVFGPINTGEPDLSDITELVYMRLYSMAQVIEMYKVMEDNITAHWKSTKKDDKQLAAIFNWDSVVDASEISYLNSIYQAAYGSTTTPSGLMPVFMRLFPIKSKQQVFVNVNPDAEDEDFEAHVVLPEKWSKKRKTEWAEKHKDKYEGPYERDITTLWQCVFTATGLMLSNRKHWYQNYGSLPATIMVPCLINGKPSGPGVDMAPETLRNCVARIESLDDMRKGNGQLFITKEGVLTKESTENITAEANKSLGVVYVNKDHQGTIADAYRIEKREASRAWREYAEYEKQEMNDITRINETLQGDAAPRQSGIAKSTEIGQALIVSALYFDNFNQQWENHQNLKLAMIPYIYDEAMMRIECFFEKENVVKTTVVNQPQFDMNGEKISVLNDVTSSRYRWMVSPVDDSPSAKSRYMQDALMIINGSAGPLMQSDPTGKLVSSFWSALDNPILNEAGRRLAQDMQLKTEQMTKQAQEKAMKEAQVEILKAMAEMERAKKTGVNLSFTGEQLAQYPNLMQFYLALKQQAEASAPQGPMQQPIQPLAQPSPQGGQAMQPQPAPPGNDGSGVPNIPEAPVAANPTTNQGAVNA
jgi:hypothetical protein